MSLNGKRKAVPAVADPSRPVLHLSGAKLRIALEAALNGCEELGGVEHYIDALKLKSRMFQQALLEGDLEALDLDTVAGLATFMATVRRRIAAELEADGLSRLRHALALLLNEIKDTSSANQRIAAFCAQYPADRAHRWVRDLAAEVLHNVEPERYPLMTRWVWDQQANTGALREIWFAEDIDRITLNVPDDYETFLVLREELSVFLTDNGFFRDITWYVDVLLAQIYAEYISAQGGTYLRTDFSSPEDPMQHSRRMLGLDGVKAGSAKLRLKTIEGRGFVLEDEPQESVN
jgi:hypothetical protein